MFDIVTYNVHYRYRQFVNEVQNNTCIEFAQKDQEIIGQNGINFLKSNICESEFIGAKFENKPQYIYLTDECSYSMRTIRSLLFEALGLLPQVFRKDRNHYVTLKFLYMDQSKVPRFYYNYQPINNSLRFYDFSSITHFNSTMYSVNETLKVITPIVNYSNFYENMMGRIEEPSFFDYKVLNNYYCKNTCPKENYCSNHGYHINHRCNKCICSLSYRNDRCEVINYGNLTICGYTSVYAISHLQHIVRSNIDYCLYHLVTHDIRGHVFIRFPYFRGMFLSKICSLNNSIEIKYQERLANPGICLCYSDDIEAPEIISESYHMIVICNFQVYKSYAFFEYMKVNSIDFKYRHLNKYERISHLISNECNQLHYDDLSEKCIKAYHGIF
uniref:Metalloendopeptidase n=1 Tax=Parastrongyloides trichosuri TaxID=131310 RepID=A0A0N4ZZQ7_PARTI